MPWKYSNKLNNYMTFSANDSEGEICIYGDIVDDAWWDDETSPKTVRNALKDMGNVTTVNLRVNSFGGSVYAGNAIINILDTYRKKKNCKINAYIEGIAASMSSGVPMVADKIYMAENAMFMLHKPWSIAYGNSYDMQKTIEELEKAEDTLVVNYMRKFNGTEDELRQLLIDETWLTADEALDYGFCDEIIEAVPVSASANGIRINSREFVTNAVVIAAKFIPTNDAYNKNPKNPPHNTPKNNKKQEGDKNMHVYDESLNTFGITKEIFDTFDMEAKDVLTICNTVKSSTKAGEAEKKPFITYDMAKEAIGEDISAEDFLALAKSWKEADPEAAEKAKAYDKLYAEAIEDAIKAGQKAKGAECFKESKWRKLLNALDYSEVIDQKKEWEQEAKNVLHAGKRVSQPWKPTPEDNGNVNPDNYNFC